MDDNTLTIIAIALTILIGAVGGGLWYKFTKFIGSVSTLLENLIKAMADKNITVEEVKQSIKDAQVVVDNGFGLVSKIIGLFKR